MTDVWTGEKIPFTKEISFDVTAHGSRLLAVSDTNGLQLLDADVRILSSIRTASTIELETDYEADAKLVFNREIRKIFFNGQAIKAKIQGNTVNLHIPEKGILSCSAD